MVVRVRLLSGEVVWEGERPATLAALRAAVALAWGAPAAELAFCHSGPSACARISNDEAAWGACMSAPLELLAVRDPVLGLQEEFLSMMEEFPKWTFPDDRFKWPERLRPALEHRGCMLAAVKQNGWVLRHASAELRADRELVLAAVGQQGAVLEFASPELRADRDVVLAAVGQNGRALEFASPELRADRELVLAAVGQNGRALEFASPELRADRDFVLAAASRPAAASGPSWGGGAEAAAELDG